MKKETLDELKVGLAFIITCLLVGFGCAFFIKGSTKPPDVEIKLEQPEFFLGEISSSKLKEACLYYDIKFPEIVTAQAILESGHFKSKTFINYNNPFGLYNSKKKDYYKFDHWTDALVAYRDFVQCKYIEGSYYEFLEYLPYAMDKEYINKIKRIESNLPP